MGSASGVSEPAAGFQSLLDALEAIGIPYMVCGSLASSVHGDPRTTQDVDLVVALRPDQLQPLAGLLQDTFYVDLAFMKDSLQRGRSFNVIHVASAYKFDLFPLSQRSFEQQEFQRRYRITTPAIGAAPVAFFVATAEDTLLSKLVWYRQGGQISEKQWNDLRGIRNAKTGQLDEAYLRQWAAELGVLDLLEDLLSGG
jgi:hypothetical protein